MAKLTVSGEMPFQVLAHSFTVSPSSDGYTLQYSADGINYTSYTEAIPANETLICNGVAWGQFIRLSGNTDTVIINF